MYNYNFEMERILLEFVENLISIDDSESTCNIIITEENLMIFNNIKKNSVLSAKNIIEMPEYELLIKINLNDIDYEVDDENTTIRYRDKEIILYDFDLSKAKLSIFTNKSVIY